MSDVPAVIVPSLKRVSAGSMLKSRPYSRLAVSRDVSTLVCDIAAIFSNILVCIPLRQYALDRSIAIVVLLSSELDGKLFYTRVVFLAYAFLFRKSGNPHPECQALVRHEAVPFARYSYRLGFASEH